MDKIEFIAIKNFPFVEPGDDLCQIIADTISENSLSLEDGDVIIAIQD